MPSLAFSNVNSASPVLSVYTLKQKSVLRTYRVPQRSFSCWAVSFFAYVFIHVSSLALSFRHLYSVVLQHLASEQSFWEHHSVLLHWVYSGSLPVQNLPLQHHGLSLLLLPQMHDLTYSLHFRMQYSIYSLHLCVNDKVRCNLENCRSRRISLEHEHM